MDILCLMYFVNVYLDFRWIKYYLEFEFSKYVVYWIIVCACLCVCVKERVVIVRDKLFNMIFLYRGEVGWVLFFGLWFVLWNVY